MFLKAAHGRQVFIPLNQIHRAGCNCYPHTRWGLNPLRRWLPRLKVSCGFARCCIAGTPAGCSILRNEASFQIRAYIRRSDIRRGAWAGFLFSVYKMKNSQYLMRQPEKSYMHCAKPLWPQTDGLQILNI
jgi:hypothetical protein